MLINDYTKKDLLKLLGGRYIPGKGWYLPDQEHVYLYLTQKPLPEIFKKSAPLSTMIPGAKFYQTESIGYLVAQAVIRHILADDMGLGKTYQAIQTARQRQLSVVVVCPNSLKFNWQNEFSLFDPDIKTFIIDGIKSQRQRIVEEYIGERCRKALIVNYESVRIFKQEFLKCIDEQTLLIADEAHRLKNPRSQQSKAFRLLAEKAIHLLLLTGTPIKNRPEELWHLLHLLDPKEFSSFWRFVNIFCSFEETPWARKIIGLNEQAKPLLNYVFNKYAIRRTKEEVLHDLPEKIRVTIPVELSSVQKKLYNQIKKEFLIQLSEQEKMPIANVISQIMRLRQVCLDPEIVGVGGVDFTKLPKVQAILDIVEDNPDEKIIIFSNFKSFINRLYDFLPKGTAVKITGDTPAEERQEAVKKFQGDSNTKIFLGTIGAAGVGLTLTAASLVVFTDKAWSPADNRQAEDRAYRIGQKNTVKIITLYAKGTVEEKIEKILEDKEKIFLEVVDTKRLSMLL